MAKINIYGLCIFIMLVKSNYNKVNIQKGSTQNFKGARIYDNIDKVDECLTPFMPVFIKHPKFPEDVFQRYFSGLEPKKRHFLHKFANLEEFYKNIYNLDHLKLLESKPVIKLKSLYSLAYLKDSFGMLRFSPGELFLVARMPEEKLKFLKPFARQKDNTGKFNFTFKNLMTVSDFSKQEAEKAMCLFDGALKAEDLIQVSKDEKANVTQLKKRLNTLQKLFCENIEDTLIQKTGNKYVISIRTKKEHSVHKYIFDNNFNINKNYKSDIDFEKEEFVKKSLFKRINIFKPKESHSVLSSLLTPNLRAGTEEHFYALDRIQESIDHLRQNRLKAYCHNYYVMQTGDGKIIDSEFNLPKNLLVDFWEKGAISNEDLIKIVSQNAGMIPKSDYNYFAQTRIKMTPYDTEKYLDIRQKNALSPSVKVGTDYYNTVLQKTLSLEEAKLAPIRSERKMIIIDGLPGSGKSTIIRKLLKNDSNAFYTPDSDDIKGMFSEVYKNGEGAALVHEASGVILREEILPRVFNQGKNFIYQTTGSSESIHEMLSRAKNYGYIVDFIHIATPKSLSVERSISRYNHTGRFIDPYVILSVFNKNNNEKKYAAKIFSYDERVANAYRVEDGQMLLIEKGQVKDVKKV